MLRWLVWTSATLAVLLLVLHVYTAGTVFGWRPGMPNPCFPTAANPY